MSDLKAALYIRVSTDDQKEFSPKAQEKALITYAKRNNMQVIPEYIFSDEGFSGKYAEKRPAFMRMIGLAKTKPKPYDIILVHKFDRFARNREDSIVYKSMLKKDCGIRVISITESLEEDDKMSILIEAIMEAMGEFYSINLSEEVKKGMTEKARQGGFQTSPPLGYQMSENNKLTINKEEVEYIRYIFNQYLEQDKSPHQIAKMLNQMGVKSKRGNTMDSRGIQYILHNPVYIGKVRWTPTEKAKRNFNHPDTIIEGGNFEPIISEEQFQSALQKLAKTEKGTMPKRRPLTECRHWLSGLVKCSSCGSSLALGSTKCPSFQCNGYAHAKCSVSHSISVNKLEKAILKELAVVFECVPDANFQPKVTRTDASQDEIILLEKQLSKLEDKLYRAKEAYLFGVDDLKEYQQNKIILEEQKQGLVTEIESLKNNQPSIANTEFKNRLEKVIDILNLDGNMEIKQKAIRSMIEKIIYDRPNENLAVYYYDM